MTARQAAARQTPERSTTEVLDDHLRRRADGDVEGDITHNYAADTRVFSREGVRRRHAGVRDSAEKLDRDVPGMRFSVTARHVDGDVAYLEWSAVGDGVRVDDGADSFVIRDGRIEAQTVHYTVRRQS